MAGNSEDFDKALKFALCCIGKDDFTLKAEQLDAIKCIYDGKDVFLWLPTGFGKSICYETLPFVFSYKHSDSGTGGGCSVVLVVSPLVSLMVDQVANLRSRGVSAAIIGHSGAVTDKKLLAAEKDLTAGKYNLLFTAPEAIIGVEKWREIVQTSPLSERIVAVAVDEAHCVSKWSVGFRPAYARLHELRALVPPGTPMLAATATATKEVRRDVTSRLNMEGCEYVFVSPDRPNIYYEVRLRTTIEDDLAQLVESIHSHHKEAERVIVYCRSLNLCADLYAHFRAELGDDSYYPSGAPHVSENRLFGMFHADTADHNKTVILHSLQQEEGVVRVVFATVVLGMGVNFSSLNTTIHYGAPRSIDDFFQESGRAGRSVQPAKSIVYWKPTDAPLKKDLSDPRNAEMAAMRRYLENCKECRRSQLLSYFDRDLVYSVSLCTCCHSRAVIIVS